VPILEVTLDLMSGKDCRRMADLHCRCLSDSMVSRLGRGYAASFYRYVERSETESAFVYRRHGFAMPECTVQLGRRFQVWEKSLTT
jgi:hypothetical protein